MTNRIALTLICTALAFTACKNDLEPQESSVPAAQGTTANTPPQDPNGQMQPQMQPQPQPQNNAPVTVGKGMNPAHGQPGHRCDIAVGAPLNSAPAKISTTTNANANATQVDINKQIEQQMRQQNATPAILNKPVEEGMNPAHGQEGHRCDIAVGAPLPKAEKTEN